MAATREELTVYDINPQLGAELGLAQGDAVELTTDYWKGLVGDEGERGTVQRFLRESGVTFVLVHTDTYGAAFPFTQNEIKKVDVTEDARP
ncbi:hypothetical protein ACGFYA_20780 [Streptomyces sp. NPDC048305]|uniref:hypothetical protein n=1 Tax=Streptomyces sp. NPDC048305 TaxID=3365532 RepID=UPI0037238CE8